MKYLYKYETYRNEISLTFNQIWTLQCEQLAKHVKTRGPEQRRRQYKEKYTGEFGNYATVEKYGDLEEELWFCLNGPTETDVHVLNFEFAPNFII
jgi:hypothetical protein